MDGRSSGAPLSSRRLLDLRCSGSDAPIVTPYRSPTHRHRQKCTRLDAALPRERVRSMPQLRPCADRCRAVLKVSRAGLTSRWFRLYGGTRTQFLEIARDDRLTFLDTFI